MFLHTFLLVFIAEMADKTQLMMISFTNRYSIAKVIIGMILGACTITSLSVLAGDFIGDVIPMQIVKIFATIMFLGYGFYTLIHNEKSIDSKPSRHKYPLLAIAFSFLIAELGDKTQLASVALAADHMQDHMAIFLGASLGLILANVVGIFAGKFIFKKLSEDLVKIISALIFIFFGSISFFKLIEGSFFIYSIYSVVIMILASLLYNHFKKPAINS